MLLDHNMAPDSLNDLTGGELKALLTERVRRLKAQQQES